MSPSVLPRALERGGGEDESADVVTIRNVLWTLENPEAALSLAYRILRPGGTLLVSDVLWYLHRPNGTAVEFGVELPFFQRVDC